MLLSSLAFADRVVSVPSCPGGVQLIELTNPSTVPLTVDINFYATGAGYTIGPSTGNYGRLAVSCSDSTHCSNASSYKTVAANGGHLHATVGGSYVSGNSDPTTGIGATITVHGNSGYLTGYLACGGNIYTTQLINGGRAF